jgi:hypothetical protein
MEEDITTDSDSKDSDSNDRTGREKTVEETWKEAVVVIEEVKAVREAEKAARLARHRTMSERRWKRRADESPEKDERVQAKKGTQETGLKSKRGLHEMGQLLTEVNEFITENRNVHMTIKEIITEMKSVYNGVKIASEEEEMTRNLRERDSKRQKWKLDERVKSLEEQLKTLTTGRLKIAEDKVAQLSAENERLRKRGPWAGPKGGNDKLTSVEGIDTLQKWKEVEGKTWEERVFSNTEIVVGNPVTASDLAVKVVLIDPEDPKMEKSIQRIYRDRYPELAEATEDFEILEQISRIRSRGQHEQTKKTVVKIVQDGTDEVLWNRLTRLRDETIGVESVVMHHVKCMSPKRLQKMTESIFQGTKTRVKIYTTSKTRVSSGEAKKREKTTYALVVEDEGKDYKTILNSVRSKIGTDAAGGAIRSVRSTRRGKLLVTTERSDENLEALSKAIRGASDTIKVRKAGNKGSMKALHIRGMDALTEKDEVVKAIENKVGSLENKTYKLSELRPNANDTLAVTLVINEEEAQKIIKDRWLRVGIARCSVEERIRLYQCFRCWKYDHVAAKCTEGDKWNLCRKCGEEGHRENGCKNEEYCIQCNRPGHKVGSGKCIVFRRALTKARREWKEGQGNETLRQEREPQRETDTGTTAEDQPH